MTTLTDDQVRAVAEYLEGTCMNTPEGACAALGFPAPADDQEAMNLAVRLEQVGEIFLCDGCGWYCEASEMHDPDKNDGEQLCGDCASDHDE